MVDSSLQLAQSCHEAAGLLPQFKVMLPSARLELCQVSCTRTAQRHARTRKRKTRQRLRQRAAYPNSLVQTAACRSPFSGDAFRHYRNDVQRLQAPWSNLLWAILLVPHFFFKKKVATGLCKSPAINDPPC